MLVLTVAHEILPNLIPVTSLTSPTFFFTLFRHTGLHSAFNVPSTLPPRGLCTCCSLQLKGRFPASLQIWHFLDSGLSSRIAASGRPCLTTVSRHTQSPSQNPLHFTSSTASSTCETCSGEPGVVTPPGLSTGLGGCRCSTLVLNKYSSQAPCLPSIMCVGICRHRIRPPTQTPTLSRTLGEWQGLREARMEDTGWASRALSQLRESPG